MVGSTPMMQSPLDDPTESVYTGQTGYVSIYDQNVEMTPIAGDYNSGVMAPGSIHNINTPRYEGASPTYEVKTPLY